MRNLILTAIVITTTLSPNVSYGGDGVGEFVQYNSIILESVGERKQLFSSLAGIQPSNAIQYNLDSGNAIPEEPATVTAGGVALAIILGVVVAAMLAANKSPSGSNAPSSQQTANMNR